MTDLDYNDWINIYIKLVNWDMELDIHPEIGLRQTLTEQKKECNQVFCKYVEKNYKTWIESVGEKNTPILIIKFVLPQIFEIINDLRATKNIGFQVKRYG